MVATEIGKSALNETLTTASSFFIQKHLIERIEKKWVDQVETLLTKALGHHQLIMAALAIDQHHQDQYWMTHITNIAMESMDQKQMGHIQQMVQGIAKSVIQHKIPRSESFFQQKEMIETQNALSGYIGQFLERFNKKIEQSRTKIEQEKQQIPNQLGQMVGCLQDTSNISLEEAPIKNIDEGEILAHTLKENYNSAWQNIQPMEPPTVKGLVRKLKGEVAKQMLHKVQDLCMQQVSRYTIQELTNLCFSKIDKHNSQLKERMVAENRYRQATQQLAQQEGASSSGISLSQEAEKVIQGIEKGNLPQDDLTLGMMAKMINRRIWIYDKDQKIKNRLGTTGKPILLEFAKQKDQIGHFTPMDKRMSVGHSGSNQCWVNSVWPQLTSQERARYADTPDLFRHQLAQEARKNSEALNKACALKKRLQDIAPDHLREGGKVFEYLDPAYWAAKKQGNLEEMNRLSKKWTRRETMVLRIGGAWALGMGVSSMTGGVGWIPYLSGQCASSGVAMGLDKQLHQEVKGGNWKEALNLAADHLPLIGSAKGIYHSIENQDLLGFDYNLAALGLEAWGMRSGIVRSKGNARARARTTVNPYTNMSQKELLKSKSSYERLIMKHQNKLKAFKKDPIGNTHPHRLKQMNADHPTQGVLLERARGRIHELNKQIAKQRDELAKINKTLKK